MPRILSKLKIITSVLLVSYNDKVTAFLSPSISTSNLPSFSHIRNHRLHLKQVSSKIPQDDNDVEIEIEPKNNPPQQRREMLQNLFFATSGALTTSLLPSYAVSADSTDSDSDSDITIAIEEEKEEVIQVYFGCGCFWHVQHEFVQAEKNVLQRTDDQVTARAGYAGGTISSEKVCYHNAAQIGDYGSLGHAEVVSLKIPSSKFGDFAKEYCQLFDSNGNRPDQLGDRGLEYRNVVGVPGGVSSKYAQELVKASTQNGDKLDFARGKGMDKDARAVVFVMDTKDYPFYVAEQYHQFHDGFNLGENYPNSYNGLAAKLAKDGTLGVNACPNGLLGLGALGL